LDDAFAFPINDPQTSFTVAPYVGWFRAALPRPDRALTFTLVNVQLPPRNQIAELALLPQLFRAVRNDGRGEDDVILLGNLECGLELSDPGLRQAGLSSLLAGRQTTTRGDAGLDHIIIDPQATTEFMGEAGVWDFLKHYNLTLAEALQISDHLPVWAEFSIFEGATPGRVAQDTVNQLLQ
jgi:hypothetical protein